MQKYIVSKFSHEPILFSKKMDTIYFSLLFFFLIFFAIYSLYFSQTYFLNNSQQIIGILVSYLFFNSIHTLFTLGLLIGLPEFRSWLLKTVTSFKGVFVFLVFIFLIYYTFIHANRIQINATVQEFGILLFLTFKCIHNLGQTKGLSLLLNRDLKRNVQSIDQKKFLQAEERERHLFNIFLILLWIEIVGAPFYLSNSINLIKTFGYTTGVILTGLLVLNFSLYPGRFSLKKLFLLLSTLFFGFGFSSVLAANIQRALHGVEYVFFSRRMTLASKGKPHNIHKYMLFCSGFAVIIILHFAPYKMFPGHADGSTPWGAILTMTGLLLEYSHYYLDSLMFKFKNEDVAMTIGTLLDSKQE